METEQNKTSLETLSLSFPYVPYSVQLEFCQKLMNVIETGTIGILESPTGTGKSLSIVCGVLTWLRQYYERNGIEKEKGTNEETDEPAWVTEFEDSLKKNQTEKAVERFARRRSLRQHRTLLNRVERSKTILETSSNKKHKRSHSGNFQDNKLVGADPDDEWLLSDTVFKDTSILSSEKEQLLTLGSGNEEMSEEEDECKELPRIYYCSRTHSQLLQFQEEVKRTIANMQWSEKVPRPSVLILSSRKNLCINEKVSSLSNANLINERCMELTSKEPGSPGCCPYYHLEGQRILRDHLSSEIVDIEELVNLGKERRACPYYGMKRAIKSSQFILLPYQSLLHKPTRESLRLPLHSNCIVIFDEAHHVVDALNDMYGAETNTQQIQSCLFGLKRYIDCYETRLSSLNLFMLRQFHSFLESLVQFSSLHLKIPPIDGETQNVFTVEDFVTRLGIDNLNIFKLNEFLESKCLHLKLIGLLKSRILSDSNGTDPCQGIHAVFHFVQTLKQPYSKSRIIVKFRKDIGCTFKMLVLHAANNLTEIISLVRSVVFVGGTLEPLRDIKLRLLGTFEDSHIVHCSFDHVIPDSHILPIIVSRGPTRVPLEFTYATRESEILIHELGRMLLNICRVVPGGVVVFFSSYSYCSYALNYLQQKDIWKLLLRQKAIFKEPQESLELNNVLDNYKKAVYEQQGGILFAVIGGKLSEGINFQDDLGRCIIVVGMPFPNHLSIELQESINYITGMFPSVSSKEILEDMCMKLVNQTIGRTIRHISDYGAVLLVDQRFARPAISNKLPKWLRRRLAFPDDFGWVLSSLADRHSLPMWKRVTGEESIRFNRSWREASFDVTSLYRLSALSQHWCCTSSRVTTRDDNASRVDSFNLSKSKFLKPKVVFKTAAEILHSVTEAHGKSAAQFADDLFDESKALMADSGNADALRKRLDAAVDAGHLTAMKMLGSLFLSSTFSEDYSQLRGENLLEAAAAGGETDALYEIAVQLRSGAVFGIAPGLDRIHRLLLKAADQGHEQAQFFLGILYITGELNGGVPCYEKAEHFLKASASSGLGLAQFILGIFVLRGWSPTTEMILQSKDAKRIEALRKQAIKLIESAASKNHKNAMLWLKALYDQERLQKKQNSSAEKLTTEKPVDSG